MALGEATAAAVSGPQGSQRGAPFCTLWRHWLQQACEAREGAHRSWSAGQDSALTPHSGGSDPVRKLLSRYRERSLGKPPAWPHATGSAPPSWLEYSDLGTGRSSRQLGVSQLQFLQARSQDLK